MSTVNFGFSITETAQQTKRKLLAAVDSLADVDNISLNKVSLAPGKTYQLNPTKLLAVATNNVPILIHITVNSVTVSMKMNKLIILPVSPDDEVYVVFQNPTSNNIEYPATLDFVVV